MSVTMPTLAWVIPLVGVVCWGWYRTMTRLWDRYVTPWLLRRLTARLARHEPFFELIGGGPDPANETLDEYLARASAQGHYCCMCPKQTPPLPCCNPGHDEAVARYRALEQMETEGG